MLWDIGLKSLPGCFLPPAWRTNATCIWHVLLCYPRRVSQMFLSNHVCMFCIYLRLHQTTVGRSKVFCVCSDCVTVLASPRACSGRSSDILERHVLTELWSQADPELWTESGPKTRWSCHSVCFWSGMGHFFLPPFLHLWPPEHPLLSTVAGAWLPSIARPGAGHGSVLSSLLMLSLLSFYSDHP